jgi:hypothetical protein
MDGWVGGWMDGWVGGWMDGWMDGWIDGWMDGSVDALGSTGSTNLIGVSSATYHPPPRPTGGKPLTSPKTNLAFAEAQSVVAPNVSLRGLVIEYREQKGREWAAAERRWQEAQRQGRRSRRHREGEVGCWVLVFDRVVVLKRRVCTF